MCMAQHGVVIAEDDGFAIEQLVYRWGVSRDSGDWPGLAACFTPGARLHLSWINSTAEEFVARCMEQSRDIRPGTSMKHVMSGPCVEVNGARAVSRTNVLLVIRDQIEGCWIDMTSHFRFFDRLERHAGRWLIARRDAVYDMDRVDPVCDLAQPEAARLPWRSADLSLHPPQARHLFAWLRSKGLPTQDDVITAHSAAEGAWLADARGWLIEGC